MGVNVVQFSHIGDLTTINTKVRVDDGKSQTTAEMDVPFEWSDSVGTTIAKLIELLQTSVAAFLNKSLE